MDLILHVDHMIQRNSAASPEADDAVILHLELSISPQRADLAAVVVDALLRNDAFQGTTSDGSAMPARLNARARRMQLSHMPQGFSPET